MCCLCIPHPRPRRDGGEVPGQHHVRHQRTWFTSYTHIHEVRLWTGAEPCHRNRCRRVWGRVFGGREEMGLPNDPIGLRTSPMGLRTDPVVGLEWSGRGRGHVVQCPLDPHPGVHEAVVLEHQHGRRAPRLGQQQTQHTAVAHQSSVRLGEPRCKNFVDISWTLLIFCFADFMEPLFRGSGSWKERIRWASLPARWRRSAACAGQAAPPTAHSCAPPPACASGWGAAPRGRS